MKLKLESLKNKEYWANNGIILPKYNIDEINSKTLKTPTWLHFGAGNIFRALVCNRYQDLLDKGLVNTGIIAVESFDYEIVDKIYTPYNNLALLVASRANGEAYKRVISSVSQGITTHDPHLWDYIKVPELQILSFTITEKGYSGYKREEVLEGPNKTQTLMPLIASLLYTRFLTGAHPITLLSLDNCSHNGDLLKKAITEIAMEWQKLDFVPHDFIDYLTTDTKISFPLSMIDKITPRPSEAVKNQLESLGLLDIDIIVTSKNTYMAPFVNAEISEYLVIEDKFANGRPPLEETGIILTQRDVVNNVETMKVTTCLNPLHTALAVTCCLLGYTLIADEITDPILKKLVEVIGYKEGLKTVINPGIISPKDFLDEVINERLPNRLIPDSPQRIATDTSQKVGIRFGHTIKSYVNNPLLKVESLVGIPLAIAAWLRYLHGTDDKGNKMELSPDPMLENLRKTLETNGVKDIIGNKEIFGMDLYQAGIGNKIEEMYLSMLKEENSVRNTLGKYLNESN